MLAKKLFVASCCIAIPILASRSFDTHCRNTTQSCIKQEPDSINITRPWPDTANFPSSAFTIPKGRLYFENYPLAIDSEGNNTPFLYNWPFLLRIGVTDFFEFRFASQGFTHISAHCCKKQISGLSPLIFGSKTHIWGSRNRLWTPSIGLELFVITPFSSQQLNSGTQLVANTLFDHTFPNDVSLEWNVGVGLRRFKTFSNFDDIYALVSWSLTKELSQKVAIFFQGFYNTSQWPLYPRLFFLGIGYQQAITNRFCIYGNFNWSMKHNTNPYIVNVGFTVAF